MSRSMPLIERDPWRMQYFVGLDCPDDVVIPTEEQDAWKLFPRYRWTFNKLLIADSQGLSCGLHGIDPPSYPVFSKPVYNMRGMGVGSRILRSPKEYERYQRPGHIWMELLEGEHVSTDVAVVRGEARWWRHVLAKALGDGKFDYWTILAEARPEIERYCGEWIARNLPDYTGIVNLETIGARIIEAHLRFADQWPDLYGRGWLDALVRLYARGVWDHADDDRRDGYSVVLFGAHGVQYRHPDRLLVERLLDHPRISSIQITFHEDKPTWAHSMPPGGFRLAVINGSDLDAGIAARQELALAFWSTQRLVSRRGRVGVKLGG
ncbi:MAG TPA: hypothetical protein VD788_08365 [Candidatus Polarisedimenticolaceae bacterium]|nr:hypothetical protein [Candidatus Polarisedimenticolaceae bacterium]